MSQMFRTTLRLDPNKPQERRAAEILRSMRREHGLAYGTMIAPAVIAYYDNPLARGLFDKTDDELRSIIREAVREELAKMTLMPMSQPHPAEQAQEMPEESHEPDDDELDDVFDCFGS